MQKNREVLFDLNSAALLIVSGIAAKTAPERDLFHAGQEMLRVHLGALHYKPQMPAGKKYHLG